MNTSLRMLGINIPSRGSSMVGGGHWKLLTAMLNLLDFQQVCDQVMSTWGPASNSL